MFELAKKIQACLESIVFNQKPRLIKHVFKNTEKDVLISQANSIYYYLDSEKFTQNTKNKYNGLATQNWVVMIVVKNEHSQIDVVQAAKNSDEYIDLVINKMHSIGHQVTYDSATFSSYETTTLITSLSFYINILKCGE